MRMLLRVLPAAFGLLVLAAPAQAECTDPPSPGVEWTRCYFDGRDFSGVNLAGARLKDTTFTRGNLQEANLSGADASRAKFIHADLRRVQFDGATLREADFTNADLRDVSLAGADLSRARLFRADLRGAGLTDARTRGADLLEANLSGATWVNGQHVCAEGSIGQCR